MRIERIALAAMRPDPNNPRRDFGDVEALAATFAYNAEHPGEPLNPPIVVADGSVYRIIDGERRYRAMLHLEEAGGGGGTCHAVVCESMGEADAIVAMLATDDKRALSEQERAVGIQRMLVLGIDEDEADRAARVEPGTSRRVRAAMGVAGERAEQMTFDQLFAIEEARSRGDEEAAREIAEAEVGDERWPEWRLVAERHERAAAKAAQDRALREACESRGIALVGERPRGSLLKSTCYVFDGTAPEELAGWVERLPDGVSVAFEGLPEGRRGWPNAEAFEEAPELSEEEAEALSSRNRAKSDMMRAKSRRVAFVGERIGEPERIAHVLGWFADGYPDEASSVEAFARRAGIEAADIPRVPDPWYMAREWAYADCMTQQELVEILFEGSRSQWLRASAVRLVGLLDALVEDGYEPDEHEALLVEACKKVARATAKRAR